MMSVMAVSMAVLLNIEGFFAQLVATSDKYLTQPVPQDVVAKVQEYTLYARKHNKTGCEVIGYSFLIYFVGGRDLFLDDNVDKDEFFQKYIKFTLCGSICYDYFSSYAAWKTSPEIARCLPFASVLNMSHQLYLEQVEGLPSSVKWPLSFKQLVKDAIKSSNMLLQGKLPSF